MLSQFRSTPTVETVSTSVGSFSPGTITVSAQATVVFILKLNFQMNKFLKTSDFSRAELEEIIESAIKIKSGEITEKSLARKIGRARFF